MKVCGTGGRCERHDIALHGYPCYACQQEWERRSPRVRALIARSVKSSVTPAQLNRAREADQAACEAYDGPHDVTVERAGSSGPVGKLWNAVCTDGCGWSYFWLPSRAAAQTAADEHAA